MKLKQLLLAVPLLFLFKITSGQIPHVPIIGVFDITYYLDNNSLDSAGYRSKAGHRHPRIGTEKAYFEPLLKKDSIKLLINGNELSFSKRHRRIPKNYSPHLLFQNHYMRSGNDTTRKLSIGWLKLQGIKPDTIVAQYKLYEYDGVRRHHSKGIVKIPRSEIEGVYVRRNRKKRIFQAAVVGFGSALIILDNQFGDKF